MTAHPSRLSRLGAVFLAGGLLVISACGSDGSDTVVADTARTITVEHGPVPAPVLVDLGDEGNSVGDQRIFHFDGTTGDATVAMDWIMTTTAIDEPEAGVETRVTNAVFQMDGLDSTLLLEGTGRYPGEESTFEPASTLTRAIIGGTGDYAGATGWVESTHLDDDSWTHVFHID